MAIGVISDTHGVLKPEALKALQSCRMIIHAGDVGDGHIVEILEKIAPVTVVRGNMDYGQWARSWNKFETILLGKHTIFVLHNILDLDFDPAASGIGMVVHGHTHRPKIERKDGVVYLNPGTSGPHRHAESGSVARCALSGDDMSCEIVHLTYRLG